MDEIKKQYIDGNGGGSGNYTFRRSSIRNYGVAVSHMPEDLFSFRIIFTHRELENRNLSITREHAHCLWAALNQVAKDMNWSDEFEPSGQ